MPSLDQQIAANRREINSLKATQRQAANSISYFATSFSKSVPSNSGYTLQNVSFAFTPNRKNVSTFVLADFVFQNHGVSNAVSRVDDHDGTVHFSFQTFGDTITVMVISSIQGVIS